MLCRRSVRTAQAKCLIDLRFRVSGASALFLDLVEQDAIEPRAKLCAFAEPLDVLPRQEQRLLNGLFRASSIVRDEIGDAVEALAMGVYDQPEALLVTGLASRCRVRQIRLRQWRHLSLPCRFLALWPTHIINDPCFAEKVSALRIGAFLAILVGFKLDPRQCIHAISARNPYSDCRDWPRVSHCLLMRKTSEDTKINI